MLYQLSYARSLEWKNYHGTTSLSRAFEQPVTMTRPKPETCDPLRAQRLGSIALFFVLTACQGSEDQGFPLPCPEAATTPCTTLLPVEGGGQEPAWRIRATESSLTLTLDLGARTHTAPVQAIRSGPFRVDLRGQSSDHILEVSILRSVCRDVMSGMPYPLTLEVRLDGSEPLRGCGGDPGSLLRTGQVWEVIQMDGIATLDSSRPSLRFDQETGRIEGSASCNAYGASFTLTGESLTFGTPAIDSQRPCDPSTLAQEAAFLERLGAVYQMDFSSEGWLVLSGAAGSLTAQAQ